MEAFRFVRANLTKTACAEEWKSLAVQTKTVSSESHLQPVSQQGKHSVRDRMVHTVSFLSSPLLTTLAILLHSPVLWAGFSPLEMSESHLLRSVIQKVHLSPAVQ